MEIIEGNKLIAEFMGLLFFEKSKSLSYSERGNSLNSFDIWVLNPTEHFLKTGYHYNDCDVDFFDLKLCDDYFYSLKYHTSWDWLMPVVEKIAKIYCDNCAEKTDCDDDKIQRDTFYPITFGMQNRMNGNFMFRINRMALYEAPALIESAWLAVVEFIQWYTPIKNKNAGTAKLFYPRD